MGVHEILPEDLLVFLEGGKLAWPHAFKYRYPSGEEVEVWNNGKVARIRRFYPNGTLMSDGTFLDGKKHGTYCWYFKTGELLERCQWTHGEPDGSCKQFTPRGDVIWDVIYHKRKLFWRHVPLLEERVKSKIIQSVL